MQPNLLKVRELVAGVFLVVLITNGCATSTLWSENDRGKHRPADQPFLYLYLPPKEKDILVVYDEFRERDGMTIRRAYFLLPNLVRVEAGQRPRFVGESAYVGMEIIPLVNEEEVASRGFPAKRGGISATTSTNALHFTLYVNGQKMGPYKLPVYNFEDKNLQVRRILLTPFAVTVDAATGGAVAALAAALAMARY